MKTASNNNSCTIHIIPHETTPHGLSVWAGAILLAALTSPPDAGSLRAVTRLNDIREVNRRGGV